MCYPFAFFLVYSFSFSSLSSSVVQWLAFLTTNPFSWVRIPVWTDDVTQPFYLVMIDENEYLGISGKGKTVVANVTQVPPHPPQVPGKNMSTEATRS